MLRRLFCISAGTLLSWACERTVTDEFPEERRCEKFAGNYLMYDPELDTSYVLTVSCAIDPSNPANDSIYYTNYANRFNFGHKVDNCPDSICPPNHINGTIIFGVKDHDYHTWAFSNTGYYFAEKLNWLEQDSLFIRFEISNIAFYMDEGVPYYACDPCIHYGVKQY